VVANYARTLSQLPVKAIVMAEAKTPSQKRVVLCWPSNDILGIKKFDVSGF
jgi:hypothetical protein